MSDHSNTRSDSALQALALTNEYQQHRIACADAAKPHIYANPKAAPSLECYANAEYWAGWNAAIMFAAKVAENRHSCWGESTLGNSCPVDDISACEDIAAAIRFNVHRKPCASRPTPERDPTLRARIGGQ